MKKSNATILCALCFLLSGMARAQWKIQASGTTASLRGLSVVNKNITWVSGTKGTVLRTTDGGKTWKQLIVPGAEALDFRDIQAFDATTAYVLSSGDRELSKIYKTIDGGEHWKMQYTSDSPGFFLDSMAFWDANHGIAISDPVNGRFPIIVTSDGGAHWKLVPAEKVPPAIPGEAAFAASGTCLVVQGKRSGWFATGGTAARVFHSTDGGESWTVANTPIVSGSASTGIFSIAFKDEKNGIIVGGDYKKPTDATRNTARTSDGGQTWTLIERSKPAGYRSAVAYLPGTNGQTLVAVGTSGTDYSNDGGTTWMSLGNLDLNSVSFAGAISAGWAVGQKGLIAKYEGKMGGR